LTFIDSSGLAALMRAREAADEAGAAFRVSEPSPALRRIVEITGTVELLRGE
jgi:anti-anti-sigma factor